MFHFSSVGWCQSQVFKGLVGDAAAPGRAGEKAQLHQIGLVHILQGDGLLVDGGGQGVQAYRPAVVILDDAQQHAAVDLVQAQGVDLQRLQGPISYPLGNDAPSSDLGEVSHPPQHPVGDTGCAPAAPAPKLAP